MPRHRTNQLSPIVCAMAVTPMGRVGEGQGDLVQGLRGEDGGGVGEHLKGRRQALRNVRQCPGRPGTAPSPGQRASCALSPSEFPEPQAGASVGPQATQSSPTAPQPSPHPSFGVNPFLTSPLFCSPCSLGSETLFWSHSL